MAGLKEILSWFEKNKYPTQEQFKESWTSFWHKSEKMPMEQVVGLQDELSDKALKSDLNAVETELKDKASKEELANVVAGLVPMGSVANLAELETKPKRNNDSYYVEDQLDENGNAYIYRWDAGLNLWVNTKQVVFKDVITQGLGDSSNKAMSQKAVTDELAQLESEVNTKSGYSNLVNSADAFRVEDTAGTRLEEEDRVTLLKKLDNSIVSIEAFNLPEGHHIGITTLNISRVEGDSIGSYVAIWDENGGLVHGTINLWKYEMDDPSRVSLYFGSPGVLTNVKIVVDATALGLAEGERYTFYFGKNNVSDYKKGGFKDNSIINLPIRSMWDLNGYNVCKRESRSLISDYEKQIHDIWKGIYFEATKNVLVKFNSARYNSVIDGIVLVIHTCSNDDPSNLNVTNDRNKFSRKIVKIPFEKKGLARFYAEHLADLEDNGVDISVIVDTDALFEGMASIPTHDIFTTSVDDRANWIVSPTSDRDSINTKSGYSNLVNSADAFRVEDTAGTRLEEEDRVTLLKKLDNSIVSIEAFNLPEGHHIGLRNLTISRVEGVDVLSNYVTVWDGNGDEVHQALSLWKYEMDDPSRISLYFGKYGALTNVKIVVDATALGLAEGELYSFYFGEGGVSDYKKGGFKDNSIINLPIRSMWDLNGYNVANASGRPLISDYEKQIHDIWKGIYFEATENVLVKFNSARYNSVIDGIVLVIHTCSDDNPSNLNVTNDRNKFSRKIVEIPFEKKGLARFYAKHLADLEDNGVDISVIIDTDALFEGMASIPTHDIVTTSVDDRAHWIVSPTSGGDSTKSNRLILVDNEKDYQGNFRFSPTSTDWIIDSASNLTKIIRVPDGTTSIDFSMDFNGGNSEALFFDKDMKYIERLDNPSTTNVVPPVNAIFLMASTKTPINSAKIVAKGVFEVTDSVKSYRSIHEGLGDRYSGIYFEVNGFVYKKDFNGLCTIDEYSSTDNGWLDEIPMLEVDEDFKSPQNVLHTDGITTYNGGLLCAVKDGVMYFTNHRDKAIFKSNDGGVTFTTIVDSLSHPNVWDPIDVDKEGRSVIIPLDNGELLFPIRHRGTVPLSEDRNERFYVLYRTTNNQTDLERCFTFSHEDYIRDWLPPEHPNYLWPNHSGGTMLGNFSHSVDDNVIVVTEYGSGTSKYWQTQVPPVPNNGRGVSAKAWVSFDYGVTWKKMFDADRKKVGTVEADDNWYYFSSTYNAKMRHIHGIALDKKRGVVQITNGDGEDYIWKANISDIKLWYDTAPSINDDEHPVYKPTDTFPLWETIPLKKTGDTPNNTYTFMSNQMMKCIETPKGWLWGHDASRQMACLSYYSRGEYVFEPAFSFELESDYETFEDFFNSWKGTNGFPQDIVEHEGIIYFLNNGVASRIWATSDGINWKIVCEVPVTVGFAARLIFDDDKIYLNYTPSDAASRMSGYYELDRV